MEPKLPSSIVLDSSQFPQRNHPHHSESRFSNQNHNHSSDHHIGIDEFAEFAKETFRKYEESNQRIDAFRLYLDNESYARFGLATEWTLKALKLGATDLTFESNHPNIVIPINQAVFGNKNVTRLCLQGSKKIKTTENNFARRLCLKNSKVKTLKETECPGLKSLTLSGLTIVKPESFFNIISCCPSLEDLSLSNISCEVYKDVELALVPTLVLPRLRSLVVRGVSYYLQIKTLFLDDLSSKFPNLKHLTLGSRDLEKVSSSSVETLNIHVEYMSRVSSNCNSVPSIEFDVPSIRKFTFESDGKWVNPDVSFRSISSAGYQYWEESHVSITIDDNVGYGTYPFSTKWFRQLSKFLTNLRGSKIHLCLHLHSKKLFDYHVGELKDLNVCEVEDLTLDIKNLPSLSCHAILDGLFRICRPKMFTQYLRPPENNNDNDLIICRLLERAMQVKSVLLPSHFMYGLHDLEGIDAQKLIDEVWTPQPLGSILADLADSTSQQSKRRFRLQLKWKQLVVVS